MSSAARPTLREERRAQTVREIKDLAMDQISQGGPDAVSLSGIVREMSMSPAAVYRYFVNRDALLADLVVDAYDELADHLVALERAPGSAEDRLDAVLRGIRVWATEHPNAYRLIFQTSVGSRSGLRRGPDRGRRRRAACPSSCTPSQRLPRATTWTVRRARQKWTAGWRGRRRLGVPGAAHRAADCGAEAGAADLDQAPRHHQPRAGRPLAATGIGADVLFDAEVRTIGSEAVRLPRAAPRI